MEKEQYVVITMDGDLLVPDQQLWGVKFDTLEEAIKAAQIQHEVLDDIGVYTMVVSGPDADKTEWIIHEGSVYTDWEAQIAADILGAFDQNYAIEFAIQKSKQLDEMRLLVIAIQDALGTAETGDALVEVARNAHKAEMAAANRPAGVSGGIGSNLF